MIFNLGLLRGKNDGKEAARRPVEEEDERKGECSGQKWYIFYLEPEVRWWREKDGDFKKECFLLSQRALSVLL